MTAVALELAPVLERPPDNEYTNEALPDVIQSGAVRSWQIEMAGCEATVGEIDPHTQAAFLVVPRGERLTFVPSDNGLGRLALILVQGNQARFVTIDKSSPTVQTLPGQLIVIPDTGEGPTHYLCEYRNEGGQLSGEVRPKFESVRSYVWGFTHYHPRSERLEYSGKRFVEIDKRAAGGPRINFTYKEPVNAELGAQQTMGEILSPIEVGRISITGRVDIENVATAEEWSWHLFVLKSDGSMSYAGPGGHFSSLMENEQAGLYKWLASRYQEWWAA